MFLSGAVHREAALKQNLRPTIQFRMTGLFFLFEVILLIIDEHP